jgi:hypothetical protein
MAAAEGSTAKLKKHTRRAIRCNKSIILSKAGHEFAMKCRKAF